MCFFYTNVDNIFLQDRGCEKGRTSVADPHYIIGAGFRIFIDELCHYYYILVRNPCVHGLN